MRIGIDLDGVVFKFVDALRQQFAASGIKPYEDMPDPTAYEIWLDWQMERDAFYAAFIDYETIICQQGQAYDGALEGLKLLKDKGHSIHIITSRMRPQAQTATVGWLAANGVHYDTLTFAEDKAGFPVDVFVEDSAENARAIAAAGVPCLLMTRPWNVDHDWHWRVTSWTELTSLFDLDDPIPEWLWQATKALPVTGEVRTISATGGEKGSKPEQYSMIPVPALAEVARVYEYGSRKYDRDNWRRGYDWHLSYDAMQRHANAFWSGQDFDPESGLHHLAHATFHAFTLYTFGGDLERYAQYDDRHRDVPG